MNGNILEMYIRSVIRGFYYPYTSHTFIVQLTIYPLLHCSYNPYIRQFGRPVNLLALFLDEHSMIPSLSILRFLSFFSVFFPIKPHFWIYLILPSKENKINHWFHPARHQREICNGNYHPSFHNRKNAH